MYNDFTPYFVVLILGSIIEFVGLEKLKEKHFQQLQHFENWAKHKDWANFHQSHYDWWMFPYNEESSHGFAYTIFEYEIELLKQDKNFMKNYLRGCELLLLSWCWDLYKSDFVEQTDELQSWQNWSVRLYKCARSLKQFGCHTEFESTKKYALILMSRGQKFSYERNDLSWLFY